MCNRKARINQSLYKTGITGDLDKNRFEREIRTEAHWNAFKKDVDERQQRHEHSHIFQGKPQGPGPHTPNQEVILLSLTSSL